MPSRACAVAAPAGGAEPLEAGCPPTARPRCCSGVHPGAPIACCVLQTGRRGITAGAPFAAYATTSRCVWGGVWGRPCRAGGSSRSTTGEGGWEDGREHPPTHPPAAAAGGRPLTRPHWGTHMANDRPLRPSHTDEDARHVPSNPPRRGL